MPITIHPPANLPPERILLFGKEGTGKTRAILTVARRCPDARFHIIDTDYSASYDRMMGTEFSDVGEQGNVTTYVVGPWNWPEILNAAKEVQRTARPGDWVVVDSMTPTWSAVAEHFVAEVHGTDMESYLLGIRKKREEQKSKGNKSSSLGAFDGWMDYSVINPMYRRLYKCILDQPGHLLITAEGTALGDNDGRQVRDTYAAHGLKPAGQKQLGFLTQTVLLTTKGRQGEYGLSTVKDRGRDELDDVALDDFAREYLQGVAGWKPRPYKVEARDEGDE